MRESDPSRRIVVGMYSFKTTNPARLAAFWGELMGLPVLEASHELVMLDFEHEHGPATWLFEKVDEPVEPSDTRFSLDIAFADPGDNWSEAADRAERLGATPISQHEQDGARWIAMKDPDGNPFRVFGPVPREAVTPLPASLTPMR